MNREQTIAHARGLVKEGIYRGDVETLVHRIFNDIESRTCSNCFHYGGIKQACPILSIYVSGDFGCNKFTRRD